MLDINELINLLKSFPTILRLLIGIGCFLIYFNQHCFGFLRSFGYPGICFIHIFVVLNFSPNKEMEHIWIPSLDEKCPNGYRLQQQQMLFPHRIMSYLFNECNLQIPEADIHQYWDNAIADGETYASVESRHRIPLGIYGDSAQLITKVQFEKILCFFLNIPIFRPRSVRYSRFLLWSCDSSLLFKNRTVNAVLRWVVWSLNCLYYGTNPTTRPGNRPLSKAEEDRAGTWITNRKHQFQVVECRGDWEFHKMIWQFKASWKGGVNVGICFRCPAMLKSDNPGLLYWNMEEGSAWCQEEFSTVEFISKMLPSRNICHCIIIKSVFVLEAGYLTSLIKSVSIKHPNRIKLNCFFEKYDDNYTRLP